MADQIKILTRNWGKPDSHKLETYLASGGYKAARIALGKAPADVTQMVLDAKLRGRGGAGFPTGLKWTFMPKNDDRPRYLLVNADEGEPGTFKDRDIMRFDPHMLLEGIIIACWAMQAQTAFIYIRGEFTEPIRRIQDAIDEANRQGFLGRGIFGTGFNLEVHIHRGAGAYICGEETSLINSLEGRRANPRIRPPFPPQRGVFDMPTTVNNVESIATVPFIVANGPEAYRSLGTKDSTGTKLFSVSGHVNRPGVYEVLLGYPFMDLINHECGGMLDGMKLKAVIPGGSSTPLLTAAECQNLKLDYESMNKAGTMLGSGAVIVFGEGTCMVSALRVLTHFYAHESCGQCTPCREGTGWMDQVMEKIVNGRGRVEDLDLMLSLATNMSGITICPLADAAAGPVRSFIPKFRAEFEHYIRERKERNPNPWPVRWKK